MKKRPSVKVVTATEAKNRFGEIIKGAYLRQEHLIVKRDGIPVVAIVPMADYERLVSPEELPDTIADEVDVAIKEVRARSHLLELLEQVHDELQYVPEAEAEHEIEESIKLVRNQP